MGASDDARERALRDALLAGQVIPAHPLALTARRTLDERHQRALTRYYAAAGAGGIAVGVHTTQFGIRQHGMLAPVLELAATTARACRRDAAHDLLLVAGALGDTRQALAEAEVARSLGYDAVLLGLGAWREADDAPVLAHCRAVAEALPLMGFYLQPAVGGRPLSYDFWRAFAEIPRVVAIKIAPFDRYRTMDVVRAVCDAGRDDIALYTGNDDSIVNDLITPFPFGDGAGAPRRIVGGLLGQWAVWTHRAVELLRAVRAVDHCPSPALLAAGAALTDANGALFDAAHAFRGSIAGINEVLRRQGLLRGHWCLDDADRLSPGQAAEIDRVLAAYPALTDDEFVAEHRDEWLR